MGARLIKAIKNIVAAIVRLFQWWFGLIGRQDTIRGKAIVACVGLLALCVVCSVPVAFVNGPKKPAPAVASVPSVRPTTIEADTPTARSTAEPTSTAIPSPTSAPATATLEPTVAPTDIPTAEPSATPAPPAKPKPTAKPAPAIAIAPTAKPASAPIPTAVDVGAAPCQPGQIKGNRNSDIYHAPGQRDYAKTYANVQCFDTEAEAVAAGYRKAKR